MEHLTLYYRQGSSDKIYQASIVPQDDDFVVQFTYGRRGSALATGTKTQAPVPYAQAKKIYDQLVASKVAKGYSPGEDGAPYQHTAEANRATSIHCQLLNPVEEDHLERLIADPAWWLQEKHDGRRMLLRKQGETITGINRLTRFIDQFRQMNFANDAEMEAQLERVRRELLTRTAAEYRDNQSATRSLRDGLSALAGKARELAKADATELVQSFGQLGRRRFHLAA